jgi:hypothetical protein
MAHEVFTGNGMTVTFNSVDAEGLRTVDIDDQAKPLAGMLDITDSNVSAYTEMADPLGGSEPAKATVTIEMLDSQVGYADNKLIKQALNTSGALAFATSADGGDNKWDHAGIELLRRTTTIRWAELATLSLEFGANSNGTWGEVA